MRIKKINQRGLRLLITFILVLGIFFRFFNLDRKVYWYDEAFTSLRISGYTQTELIEQVFKGHEIGIEDLQKYQRPNPEKGLIDTIYGLAVEEPQHSPLYYMTARFWVQMCGNSVTITRSLSALISLLVFPCIYWLCLELFKSPMTGWVAIALIAVSPFHIAYAQEAREYSLWTVAILLSSAALLRAIRLKTKITWGIYAATVVLALYSFLFSVFVAIGHGVYVVVIERFRLSKTVTAYLQASFVGLLGFVPWLVIIIINLKAVHHTTSWAAEAQVTPWFWFKEWTHNLKFIVHDLGIGPYLTPIILVLGGYSLYFLWRKTPLQVWLFILTMLVVPALGLILPDLISGGIRSITPRYQIPCYLAIQIAIAHLLATKIATASLSQRKIWQPITTILILVGLVSCAITSQAESSFTKFISGANPQIARIINKANRPLLISDSLSTNAGDMLSLSHNLDPKVRILLFSEPKKPEISKDFSDVFLFRYKSFKSAQHELETQYQHKIEPVGNISTLWRIVNY